MKRTLDKLLYYCDCGITKMQDSSLLLCPGNLIKGIFSGWDKVRSNLPFPHNQLVNIVQVTIHLVPCKETKKHAKDNVLLD